MQVQTFTRENVNTLILRRYLEQQKIDRKEVTKASNLVLRLMDKEAPIEEIKNAAALHTELCDRFNEKYPAYALHRSQGKGVGSGETMVP